MAFKKGHKYAPGGAREGAGRKPDWFRSKMAEIASNEKTVQFVQDIIEGKEVDEFLVLQTGVQVPIKADAATRLKFLQYATDHGYGKAPQEIQHTGQTSRLIFVFPEDK